MNNVVMVNGFRVDREHIEARIQAAVTAERERCALAVIAMGETVAHASPVTYATCLDVAAMLRGLK